MFDFAMIIVIIIIIKIKAYAKAYLSTLVLMEYIDYF